MSTDDDGDGLDINSDRMSGVIWMVIFVFSFKISVVDIAIELLENTRELE
jgi:hypothetical protein